MRKTNGALALVVVAGALTVVGAPAAGAAASIDAGGTTVTVTVAGDGTVTPGCSAGDTTINGAFTNPRVRCAALTRLTVNGDAGAQTVRGDGLDAAAFAARPSLSASLGGGPDVVVESRAADTINTGGGADRVVLSAVGTPNTSVVMGGDRDTVEVVGTASNDRVLVSATGGTTTVTAQTPSGTRTDAVSGVEAITVTGQAGSDTLDSTAVAPGATLAWITLDGGDGPDSLVSGAVGARLVGGAGANTLTGGAGADTIVTSSESDTIRPGGGANTIVDGGSLRSGGRAIHATGGAADVYAVEHPALDSVVRVRPVGTGASVTSSLVRPGRQDLPGTFAGAGVSFLPGADARHLVDVVLSPGTSGYLVLGDEADDDLVDITVPTGGWRTAGAPSAVYTVVPSVPGYGTVTVANAGQVSVHGPWGDADRGFAHRVHRDLLFRFASPSVRDSIADRLRDRVTTRARVVSELTDTDEYRGLDVDRVFTTYLRRTTDAAGRAYWIGQIRTGTPLWRFRAQVFGSGEYFASAGGTNAGYVRKAYNDVLGRQPDQAGLDFWVARLQTGTGRGTVALQFLNSSEARRRLLDDQFLRFLDRPATTAEANLWLPQLTQAGGEQAMIRALASGAEYAARS